MAVAKAKRTPRHEARQARTDVYRQHIFLAAEQVFADKGFEAAKLQDISKRAGLSMGTIYAVFASKQDILAAILDARGQEILERVRSIAGDSTSPGAALDALIDGYIDYFYENPDFLRMHLREGTSWVLTPTPVTDKRIHVWNQIHQLQSNVFRRGVDDGSFVKEDPGYLAKVFSAIDQVLLADWVAGGMKTEREELRRRLRFLVRRTFCRDGVHREGE